MICSHAPKECPQTIGTWSHLHVGRSGILLIGFVAVLGWNVADNKRPNVAYFCPDSIAIILQCINMGKDQVLWFRGHTTWATNDTILHWLRLHTHIEWFPHPLHTWKVFGSIHMLLSSSWMHLHAITDNLVGSDLQNWQISWGSHLSYKMNKSSIGG